MGSSALKWTSLHPCACMGIHPVWCFWGVEETTSTPHTLLHQLYSFGGLILLHDAGLTFPQEYIILYHDKKL